MSKTSSVLIAIMVAALLFMGAVRGYQWYERKVAQWEAQREQQADAFSFQQVPVSLAAPQAEPVSYPVEFSTAGVSAVFLEDPPMSAPEGVRQAQDTLRSIVQDYRNEPEIQSFNEDLSRATQGRAVDLSALSGGDLAQVLKDNPQISHVVSKHMQNPDFAKKVQEILANPQFIESVRQLQQHGAAASDGKTN